MELFLTLITAMSLIQGTTARTAACLLADDYYKTATSVEISIDLNGRTPGDSVWRTHGAAMTGKYKFWKTSDEHAYFTKPVVKTDTNRTWYMPGCVYRLDIYGLDGKAIYMSVSPYDTKGNTNICNASGVELQGHISWEDDLTKRILEKCKQDNADQVVIDASKTRNPNKKDEQGPKMIYVTYDDEHDDRQDSGWGYGWDHMFQMIPKREGVRDRFVYHKQVVDFKMTFQFGEASEPIESGRDLPELEPEWIRWLKLTPAVLMGAVGLGLIVYSMLQPKDAKVAKRARKKRNDNHDEARPSESDVDIENPRRNSGM